MFQAFLILLNFIINNFIYRKRLINIMTPEEEYQMRMQQQMPQPPMAQTGQIMGGFSDRIMGMENMNPQQEIFDGMQSRIMGAENMPGYQPDYPVQNVDQQMNVVVPQQQNMPVAQNPFAAQEYGNVNMLDTPIQFGGGMAELLLNDNEVPKAIKKKYWYVFHKDNILTFLDEERKKSKLLNFDINKIDILNAMPYYDYTFELETEFGIMRNIFETKLDRSLGFKTGGQKNERIILQSQFQESRNIQETGEQSMIKEGFFKRLLGRR